MSAVVGAARRWIGTPYVHQASAIGAGCDCLGLVRGVWREVHGCEPEQVPPYTPDWDEVARHETLDRAAARHMERIAALSPGALILFRMRSDAVAKHLGICTEAGEAARFVHSYRGHGVVENALTGPWRRRIAALFAFPDIERH